MAGARLSSYEGKALAVLLAVFIAGAASGAIGMRAMSRKAAVNSSSDYQLQSDQAVERLASELDLTPSQIDQVRNILDETIMDEADLLIKMRQVQEEGRDQIKELLDQQQREKFENMSKRSTLD